MARRIQSLRQKHLRLRTNHEEEIPKEFRTTTKGENFILHDSSSNDVERILIFNK